MDCPGCHWFFTLEIQFISFPVLSSVICLIQLCMLFLWMMVHGFLVSWQCSFISYIPFLRVAPSWNRPRLYVQAVEGDFSGPTLKKGCCYQSLGQTVDKVRYNRVSKVWLRAGNSPRQMKKLGIPIELLCPVDEKACPQGICLSSGNQSHSLTIYISVYSI